MGKKWAQNSTTRVCTRTTCTGSSQIQNLYMYGTCTLNSKGYGSKVTPSETYLYFEYKVRSVTNVVIYTCRQVFVFYMCKLNVNVLFCLCTVPVPVRVIVKTGLRYLSTCTGHRYFCTVCCVFAMLFFVHGGSYRYLQYILHAIDTVDYHVLHVCTSYMLSIHAI